METLYQLPDQAVCKSILVLELIGEREDLFKSHNLKSAYGYELGGTCKLSGF